ncbi:MAG: hypothetical protein K2H09_10005 [Treponemataceae bacterium]|nr:hypothetical protein [Treponemataceae bacterium]
MVILLVLVGAFVSFALFVGFTMVIPFLLLLLVDYFVFCLVIAQLFARNVVCTILSVILSAVLLVGTVFVGWGTGMALYNYFVPSGKPYHEKQNEAYAKEKADGVFTFKAEPYKRTSAPIVLKIDADGNLSEVSPSKKKRAYTLTHSVYFGKEAEPCGFQLTVTDKDSGKSETWLLHRKKSYFHTETGKVRFALCDDFNEMKDFFANLGKDDVPHFSHESRMNAHPLCLHITE